MTDPRFASVVTDFPSRSEERSSSGTTGKGGSSPREENQQSPEGRRTQIASEDASAADLYQPTESADDDVEADENEAPGSVDVGASAKPGKWGGFRIPKRKRHEEVQRPVQGFSDCEDSDEEDQSDDDDSSSRPSFKSARSSFSHSHAHRAQQQQSKLRDSSIFDPHVVEEADKLSPDELQFLGKYVADPMFDPLLMEEISEERPSPSVVSTAVRKPLDQEILDLLPSKLASATKDTDKTFMSIGTRLGTAFGPLTQAWSDLRSSRDGSTELDLKAVTRDIEKTMVALGQVHNAVLFARRRALLGQFVKDQRKATDLVKRNQGAFEGSDSLFGQAFHEALYRRAKGSKHLREVQKEFAPAAKKRPLQFKGKGKMAAGRGSDHAPSHVRPSNQTQSSYRGGQTNRRPFRGGPPSRGRGGGRGTSGNTTSA